MSVAPVTKMLAASAGSMPRHFRPSGMITPSSVASAMLPASAPASTAESAAFRSQP